MSRRYDCSEPMERTRGIAEAVSAVRRGELIVLPTDTVYGIGADAFTPAAVTALLDAKGRGRDMPPPVLVGTVRAATALVEDLGTYGQDLIDEFWPGALTIICRANRSLVWDLGETKGTVALRMPLHDLALELLKETGPLAVSSANLSGQAPARLAAGARQQLGDAVSVYLDGGPSGMGEPSTIVDLTAPVPRLLRPGGIPEEKIRSVVGVLLTDEDEVEDADDADDAEDAEDAVEEKPDLTKPDLTKHEPEPEPEPEPEQEPEQEPAAEVNGTSPRKESDDAEETKAKEANAREAEEAEDEAEDEAKDKGDVQ